MCEHKGEKMTPALDFVCDLGYKMNFLELGISESPDVTNKSGYSTAVSCLQR